MATTNTGEHSNDDCCICGDHWTTHQKGWLLCDNEDCPNTVCSTCASSLSLSVSDLFYCPPCAGSGQCAAATVGGAIATAVAACSSLEKLPLSFQATKNILSNLHKWPEELKYRKLRLENKRVRELVDLEPVLNILTCVGFSRKEIPRQLQTRGKKGGGEDYNIPTTEEVLILERHVPMSQVKELLEILEGLSPEPGTSVGDEKSSAKINTHSGEENGKRKTDSISVNESTNKKEKKSDSDPDGGAT